ncbi:MAG: iron-containing alcohol dehydrogenase, partial [Alicyclobacillus sp.]|nr:iron-containing alcohol dehydrogenase [Alicyclobacillus sp.]
VLDVGKGVRVLATRGGDIRAYAGLQAQPILEPLPIPLVAVPTTAGTGSEVTPFAVFSDWEQQLKVTVSSPYLAPDVALVDPTLTYSLPARATAAAGIDVLAHAAEAFLSRQASPFTDALALQAARLVGAHLRAAVAAGSQPLARRGMMEASLLAGIAFSHAGLGVTHAVAAAVSGQAHVPHGVAIGLLLPACLRFNQPVAAARCAQLAAALRGQAEPAEALADTVAELAEAIGLPQRLPEVGVQPQHWPQIAADTLKSIQLQYNPRPVETADVLALLAELA